MKTKTKRKRPSKLESQLRLSIKFARLKARINALEAEVLQLNRQRLFKSAPNPPWEYDAAQHASWMPFT